MDGNRPVRCFLVEKDAAGNVSHGICEQPFDRFGDGDVVVRVSYSSVNFKDALAARGNPGIARRLPHVPGIDAAGTVLSSESPDVRPGDRVIVTSYELGAGHWGGWAEQIRIPSAWVVPLPVGLMESDAMAIGTAGLTAGMCLRAIQHAGISPDRGEVLVTGASGGVGCLAVMLLAQAGYTVAASTGKPNAHDRLRAWGASRIVSRDEVRQAGRKPLLATRWAAAVDTVGGDTLATIVRELHDGGCVTACGLVGGIELSLTVYPFLLRGVSLIGIDSAHCPMTIRRELWHRLATDWKPKQLASVIEEIDMSGLADAVARIERGDILGRVVVRIG